MGTLSQCIDRLQNAKALEDLQATTEILCKDYGIEHVVYHWVNSVGERFGAGTYSSEWVARYLEMDYLKMDPVIYGCFQSFHPIEWKQLDWSSKAAKAFLMDAIECGVGNQGYSIPIRGPQGQFALFTVNDKTDDDAWGRFIEKNARDLIIIAHEFNKKALEFEAGAVGAMPPSLSPRELSAMAFLAKGFSRAQAAGELNISEHTLRVYIESARHKLGALNTTHAVARAMKAGLIVV